jgi:tetratricopeptide (TPR) repeat protein
VRLRSSGLVVGERAHVPGHRVRKTAYRLTHEGWEEAMRLRKRFQHDIVEVIAPNLDPTPMRVADIPEVFPAYVNLTATVSLIRGGRLDFTKLHGIGSGVAPPVLWGDSLRRLGRIFGRVKEQQALDAWATSPAGVLVVTGIAGIGKSTVVASWLVRQRPRPYIYWFEIHEGTTRTVFLRDLAAFLARLGRRGLKNVLEEHPAGDSKIIEGVLAHDLEDVSILLVLDNFQSAAKDVAGFIMGPLLTRSQDTPTKVVLISRTIPSAVLRRKGPKGHRTEVLRVEGLDPSASLALLRSKGFAGDEVALQRAANYARGHPILLSFAAQTGTAASGKMTRYLEQEIWRTLSQDERTLLEAASLFRGLMPLDSLHFFSQEWRRALHDLQAKNLLAPTISGIVVHDSIREYVRDRLPDARRRTFHALASAYFLDGSEAHDRLEGLYHLVESGDPRQIGSYLVSQGLGLADSVPASDLLVVLRKIDRESLDPVAGCVVPEILGDALRTVGDLQPALQEYRHAVRCCEAIGRSAPVPRLLRKIASVERCRTNHAKALGQLIEAQGRLKDHPDASEAGEILREMALLERTQGRLSEAAAHMNAAVDLSTEGSAPSALSRCLTALGSIETDRGEFERGLEYKREGLRIAERAGNLTETARGCISVGTSFHAMRRYEDSVKYYDRALQIARLVGNLRLMAYAMMNRCASMLDMGRAGEVGAELAEAKRLVRILEEPDTSALLDVYEGQREFQLGRWTRATQFWERGLRGLRAFADRGDLAWSLVYIGRFHLEHEDTAGAQRYLSEAAELARTLGNAALLSVIEPLLRELRAPANRSNV